MEPCSRRRRSERLQHVGSDGFASKGSLVVAKTYFVEHNMHYILEVLVVYRSTLLKVQNTRATSQWLLLDAAEDTKGIIILPSSAIGDSQLPSWIGLLSDLLALLDEKRTISIPEPFPASQGRNMRLQIFALDVDEVVGTIPDWLWARCLRRNLRTK